MSRVLIISPDYASHYFPLSSVGHELLDRGHDVVVATGPGLASRVLIDGFQHEQIVLGPGSNSGLMRPQDQSVEEEHQLEEFFAATRLGMVPTLLHQAHNRQRDLLWRPDRVADDLSQIVGRIQPQGVLVDQLAFGATAALRGLRRDFISFHPGHPSAISIGWPYGYPPRLPPRIRVDLEELDALRNVCVDVVHRFTGEYNQAVAQIDNSVEPVRDAFAATSPTRTLINYPGLLGASYSLPTRSRLIGSAVRGPQGEDRTWRLATTRRPRIYISMGTFFSARSDLLAKLALAFRDEPVEVILARGVTPRARLGRIPDHWTVDEYLPQPTLIAQSDLVLTHGGNNTVTEALTAGVPLLVGPLSTDQFAGAADVESAGLGRTFDPNFDDAATIADLAHEVLRSEAVARAAELGESLRSTPGQRYAADLVEASMAEPASV